MRLCTIVCVITATSAALLSCGDPEQAGGDAASSVVVYVALDDIYARPVLDLFEKRTGIDVLAAFDTEASKTTGLRTRLVAEKTRPRADVFWNNEVAQTILLKSEGVLEAYSSPAASAIPDQYKNRDSYWTGFAARGRVIVYNTKLVTDPPTSILDLLKPEWKGKACIAKPLFGTTATHAAALFALWGDEKAKQFFLDLKTNQIAILDSNGRTRDEVANGNYAWGLTDTDDANGGIEDGRPIKWLFPDQLEGQIGTLIIPNTLALIKGCPHPEAGKKLIDFLLSPEVEAMLAEMRSIQIPLNPAVKTSEKVPALHTVRPMQPDFEAIAQKLPQSMEFIKQELVK
jgi:iron(III) transport system substrate-binding protein